VPGEEVIAEAYDVPIPGYKTKTCGNLRLWDALAPEEFDLEAFNAGDYSKVGWQLCVLVWVSVGLCRCLSFMHLGMNKG
jgi:glucan phosphorylase